MNRLEHEVLRTVHYFNLFSYPLTPFEAWKWLMSESTGVSRGDVAAAMATLERDGRVGRREGFVFVHGRENIVNERKEKYRIAEKKFAKVLRTVRVLRFLPFVRAVAVCNSLAYANARLESDLDVVIVGTTGHLWTTRFFTAGLLAVLGLRPTPKQSQDRICLSFFLSRFDVDLSGLLLSSGDPYFAYWLDMLVPVFGDPKQFDALRNANPWFRRQLPNAAGAYGSDRRRVFASPISTAFQRCFEVAIAWMEPLLRRVQLGLLPKELSRLLNIDSRVVANESVLKFHANDRRQFFVDRFRQRLAEEGI